MVLSAKSPNGLIGMSVAVAAARNDSTVAFADSVRVTMRSAAAFGAIVAVMTILRGERKIFAAED